MINISGSVCAQDIVFSQFYTTPFLTNPALLGWERQLRVQLNYRNQTLASGDEIASPMIHLSYPFLRSRTRSPWGTAGLAILQDNAAGFLTTQGLMLGLASHLRLGRGQHFSFGLQAGFFRKRIDTDGITTDNQFVSGIFDPSASINETDLLNNSVNFPLVSGGILWHQEDVWGRQQAFLG
ncbi:MAG: PorP/SprF family type IX secretion system membrane protein, partial [Bacteroidia bacterium]|nr:PorP/SprF family type IX secretion system membrane protein [Bacteroidia bacterium]